MGANKVIIVIIIVSPAVTNNYMFVAVDRTKFVGERKVCSDIIESIMQF